jgi:hypothetical protein
MAEFEPKVESKDVEKREEYSVGDLIPDTNFAIISSMPYGIEHGKGPGRIGICHSRARNNCLNCVYRFGCDAIDLKK